MTWKRAFCPKCGKDTPQGAAQCESCGEPLTGRAPGKQGEAPPRRRRSCLVALACLLVIVGAGLLALPQALAWKKSKLPPLHWAVRDNRPTVVRLLLLCRADPNATTAQGVRPLQLAVERGNTRAAKALLAKRADPDITDKAGRTLLHLAAERGQVELVELLLARGADPNPGNKDGWTPLGLAVMKEKGEVAKLLVDRGADVNARDDMGRTLLHKVTEAENAKAAEALLDLGADVNATFEHPTWFYGGGTPLHICAGRNLPTTAKVLLAHGADVNARSPNGMTPLHVAALNQNWRVGKVLLEHGADVNAVLANPFPFADTLVDGSPAPRRLCRTPLDLAMLFRFSEQQREMENLLLQYGAK